MGVNQKHCGPYFPENRRSPNTSPNSLGGGVLGMSSNIFAVFVNNSIGCKVEDRRNTLFLGGMHYEQVETGQESVMANYISSSNHLKAAGKGEGLRSWKEKIYLYREREVQELTH